MNFEYSSQIPEEGVNPQKIGKCSSFLPPSIQIVTSQTPLANKKLNEGCHIPWIFVAENIGHVNMSYTCHGVA